MSIMVKKLYKNGTFLYKMKLLAGRNGLNNLVQWVHIVEDANVSSFLHGGELVFTAGILNNHKDWLLSFTKKLYEAGVSAFVVNIGPHTKEIPKEVADYCNEVDMPLFTIPWETRMVDMTRDFCHKIIQYENTEANITSTIKNIIFQVGDLETQVLQMERYGYQRDSNFCFICASIKSRENSGLDEQTDTLKIIAEKIAKSLHELYISFTYQEYRVLVLVDYEDAEIERFVNEFLKLAKRDTVGLDLHLGVSSNKMGIYNQNTNFEKALSAMEMAVKRNETVSFYDRLGIYKMLYAVNDKTVLRSYYREVIGPLEKYDRENDTQLLLLLKAYLENNGSLQLVAEKMFIHRNTVTNQLKKIESITGYNPLELTDKVKFSIGFYIRDILE
jgi:DNA-binding PucR family transcriptional regulator